MDINVNKWLKKLFCGSLIVFALVVGSKIICRKISKKGDKLFYICLSKDFETVKKYKVALAATEFSGFQYYCSVMGWFQNSYLLLTSQHHLDC